MFIIQLINILQIFSNIIYYYKPVYNTSEEIMREKNAYKILSMAHIFSKKMTTEELIEWIFIIDYNNIYFKIFDSLKNIEQVNFPSYLHFNNLNIKATQNSKDDFTFNYKYDLLFEKLKNIISFHIKNEEKDFIQNYIENSENGNKLEVNILINERIEWICLLSITCIKEKGKEAEFIVTNDPLLLNNKKPYIDKLDLTDTSDFDRKTYFPLIFNLLHKSCRKNNEIFDENGNFIEDRRCNKDVIQEKDKIITKVDTQPIMLMQLERFKKLLPIYLDSRKLFYFNCNINYNNNLLEGCYVNLIFNHPEGIKEKSIEIYTLNSDFHIFNPESFKLFEINLEEKIINLSYQKRFEKKFLKRKEDSSGIKLTIQLLEKLISDELLKEIKAENIKISMKLANHKNYTQVGLNNEISIELEYNCYYFTFEIKESDSNNKIKEIYKYFTIIENRPFDSCSLKITTSSNKILAEYQIFMKYSVFEYLVIFMKPINQLDELSLEENNNSLNSEVKENSNTYEEKSEKLNEEDKEPNITILNNKKATNIESERNINTSHKKQLNKNQVNKPNTINNNQLQDNIIYNNNDSSLNDNSIDSSSITQSVKETYESNQTEEEVTPNNQTQETIINKNNKKKITLIVISSLSVISIVSVSIYFIL